MSRYQVNYQRRDLDGQLVKGSVIYSERCASYAITSASLALAADEDTESFVILDVKRVMWR